MKKVGNFVANTLIGGLLVVAPAYLAILLLLKAMSAVGKLVKPLAILLPAGLPAERLLSLLLVLLVCFFLGLAVRSPGGRAAWDRIVNALFRKLPGYALLRSLTQRLAGQTHDKAWKPALAEIEEALVPAFIIEELDDGRCTVFVPSVPTPFAGSVYILTPERVHALDVPFTRAIKVVSQWGSGSKELVDIMEGRIVAPRGETKGETASGRLDHPVPA